MARRRKRTHIDRYEIVKTLGTGGMGAVYLCRDPDLDRPVAVKLLKPRQRQQERQRLRFLREALTTAQLQHPAIPPVYAVNETDEGEAYYVMKPIDGRSLHGILEALRDQEKKATGEYDLFRLVEIMRDICQACHYAHSKGYIHRDLKPGNIFVGDYGEVYIIDWGLTKMLREEEEKPGAASPDPAHPVHDETTDFSRETATVELSPEIVSDQSEVDVHDTLTMDGDILGTLAYMAPEQASCKAIGPQADIYALGVILYEMLTLTLPVTEKTLAALLQAKLAGEVEPPELRAPDRQVPPELSAVTLQAMSPNPDDRFRSAADLNRAFESWLEGKSQYRNAYRTQFDPREVLFLPRAGKKGWIVEKDRVQTSPLAQKGNAYLLIDKEFVGDVRFSVNVICYPENDEENVGEFALVVNGSIPRPWDGFVDGYTVYMAANNNTRAYLSKNEAEVAGNEYVFLEPRRQYRLTVERTQTEARVLLDRHVILFYRDREPQSPGYVGFLHRGSGIEFSGLRIQTRGMPTMTASIDVPEALMAEQCYDGAEKRFLAIALAHKNRYEGAWARYRAGMAAYLQNRDRKRALRVWTPLKKGPFAVFEKLGRASLELENKRSLRAARIIAGILDESAAVPNLEPVADIVFTQMQQLLRGKITGERGWKTIDAWARLALRLGKRLESRQDMTPAILWRWLLLALTKYPHHLQGCIQFLHLAFGKGQGPFAEVLITIEPLMTILRRSAEMADHAYLVGKVMRLILFHDDRLGNLETLARFYLHAGHEEVALRIAEHIRYICQEHDYDVPPMPITFLASFEWLKGHRERARELFAVMTEKSTGWARLDGRIFLGLDAYAQGDRDEAITIWRRVLADADAKQHNRHLVVRGLLGELPSDPVAAGVPHRADHRLLYCLFLGYKNYLDWRRAPEGVAAAELKATACRLLWRVAELVQPSYDIYSATDTLARVPLEVMGEIVPAKPTPQKLTPMEKAWLEALARASAVDEPEKPKRSSTGRQRRKSTPVRS